jgi:putative membrane protein
VRLVVCVDRDDDLGRKAGVEGPVVGRTRVLEAALRLGTADPEDSDTNAMFAAVHLLDELRQSGDEAEVVVLTGAPRVGQLSDRRVADQFDRVLRDYPADSAHLVSDGAEDEFLFPILASRVLIDGVHRVYIRQNASIESTYYTMVKALKDPKLRTKTVLPFALMLLTIGFAAAVGFIWWGLVLLVIVLGVYLVFWTFDIDEALIDSLRSASSDIRQGSVAFGFGLFSIALIGVGLLSGYNLYVAPTPAQCVSCAFPIAKVLSFLRAGLLWWFLAGEIWESGRALRRYLAGARVPRTYPVATVSIVGLGLISFGVVYMIELLEGLPGVMGGLSLIVGLLVAGFGLLVAAGILGRYLRSRALALVAEPVPAG